MWQYKKNKNNNNPFIILPGTLPCHRIAFLKIFYLSIPAIPWVLKTGHTSSIACAHIAFPFLGGWGFGTLTLTLNHYFQNYVGDFFLNVFNVTALFFIAVPVWQGMLFFSCLYPLIWLLCPESNQLLFIGGHLLLIKTKHLYQVSSYHTWLIRWMLKTFGICN